jgi:dTDP-glucose 4,6-dehydratase
LMISDCNQPVNLGNPHEMTILEMAETILKKTDSASKIVHKPLPADDPKVRQPNIERARKYLDWSPKVGLDEGLNSTIEYFRKKLEP